MELLFDTMYTLDRKNARAFVDLTETILTWGKVLLVLS